MRNGGTHGNVSVSWIIKRNSNDSSRVTTDITPDSGMLRFSQGQKMVAIPLTVVADDEPEEAEAYLLQILTNTIQGGAEVGTPTEVCSSPFIPKVFNSRLMEDGKMSQRLRRTSNRQHTTEPCLYLVLTFSRLFLDLEPWPRFT